MESKKTHPVSRILIVDQDATGREAIKRCLESEPSYRIVIAEGEKEMLKSIASDPPDLILLDVLMPDSDGFDLCLLLKADERYRGIPVLILTSLDKLEDKIRGFRVGASDYLVKPVNEVEARARVESQLRMKRYQDRQRELSEELRRTHDALMQTTKMSAVGTLAAGVAHEFNNILQIVSTSGEVCKASSDPDDWKQMNDMILDCTARGRKIVKGLLDFSKKDELQKKEKVTLESLVKQNLDLMGYLFTENGIELKTDLRPVPALQGFSGQLAQVVVNTVTNAVEAMKTTRVKRLTVGVSHCGCREALCEADPLRQTAKKNGCAMIRITDTGCGVPEKVRDRIFEPFVTTKGVFGGGNDTTAGTGMGLASAYGIVKRHDGLIRFETQSGVGSTFTVYLPV